MHCTKKDINVTTPNSTHVHYNDVVFHEYLMYFSFDSELQGEYHHEIQTLDYDYHISMKDESGLLNQEVIKFEISGATLEPSSINHLKAEEVIEEEINSKSDPSSPPKQTGFENTLTDIPHQSSSSEGVLNLEHEPSMKRLPHRHNRVIPKTTYEPELSTKVRYPTRNYVSNYRLFESNNAFGNQLSTIVFPNNV